MGTLLVIAFVVGVVTAVSPCVLPVLPVVFASGALGSVRRAVAIVIGLVLAFGLATLFGAVVLSALGLPQAGLMVAGEVLLCVLGVALLIEPLGALLERPFSRLATAPKVGASTRSGVLLGLGLGLVFVPCAGPVLATITVAAARHRVGASTVALTAAYAAGTAVPLLALALGSQRLASLWPAVRRNARTVRRVAGALVLGMGIAVWTGALTGLETAAANGFATSVEQSLTRSCAVEIQLHRLDGERIGSSCAHYVGLPDLGAAPGFADVTAWLNTPGGRPLSLEALHGKVVLVDFWTYSCINCRRSIPHVEAWYRAYARDGLVVVGVHTPEFAFEQVVSNVVAAAHQLGVTYPIDVDDGYGTWSAYANNYWPAEYLIDASGHLRYVSYGEGDYSATETAIRALLVAAGATRLPPRTDVPNRTPSQCAAGGCLTPETYLGWQLQQQHADANVNTPLQPDTTATYHLPAQLPQGDLAYGGTWDVGTEASTAVRGATLELSFFAKDVYLVLGGTGTVTASIDGGRATRIAVHGVPNLYTVAALHAEHGGTLLLHVSPGVRCFDFTFG